MIGNQNKLELYIMSFTEIMLIIVLGNVVFWNEVYYSVQFSEISEFTHLLKVFQVLMSGQGDLF